MKENFKILLILTVILTLICVSACSHDSANRDRLIQYDPYSNIDWERVTQHKMETHLHAQDEFWDGPHHSLDWYAGMGRGDGNDGKGYQIDTADRYTLLASSPGNHTYWSGDTGWEFSAIDPGFEDRNPHEMGVIAIPWMELKDTAERGDPCGGSSGFPYHIGAYFTDIPSTEHIDNTTVESALDEVLNWEGPHYPEPRAIWAHPGRHYDGSPSENYHRFTDWFETFPRAGLWGFEIFNKTLIEERSLDIGCESQRNYWDDVALWDHLLTELAPDRLIWGFAADDSSEPIYGLYLDRHWIGVLLDSDAFNPDDQTHSREEIVKAIDAGRFFTFRREPWNPDQTSPPDVPVITNISVDHEANKITIEVEQEEAEIKWVSGAAENPAREVGLIIETGRTINLNNVKTKGYVRAHVTLETNGLGEVTTQPWGIQNRP